MAFSPAALFRRDKVKDPFGGDELFDGGESRFAGQGPKLALIASGVMLLTLVGGGAAIFLTSDPAAAPQAVVGSLSDLEVVEDDVADTAAPATPAAAPGQPAPIADATAATDRSASRRPWLAAAPAPDTTPQRLGVTDQKPPPPGQIQPLTPPAAKNAAPAKPAETKPTETKTAAAPRAPEPPKIETAKIETAKAPETAKTEPAKAAAPAKPAQAKPAETKTAAVMTPPPATVPAAPARAAPAPAAVPPAATAVPGAGVHPPAAPNVETPVEAALPDPSEPIAGIPALGDAGQAPGAPRRFDTITANAGPTVAGGRPRLVEPPIPPTDKIAVAAPPPRYANLANIKSDAKKEEPPANATKVAFIVSGMGLSQAATDAAIEKLPTTVTLAFSPYARNLKKQIEKAKAKGHEVLIELPMESKQFPADDPGPLGLLTSVEAKENAERLEAILKAAEGAVGVLDTMGSKFRESSDHINPVFAKLKDAKLFYVQGAAGMQSGELGVPHALAEVTIDERPFRAAVDARLDYAERLAKYQGSVVASMSAKPVAFERLALWIEQAQKKGIVLAPVSQVLTQN
jgi:polysaccharide deacetylase 2 family uncharacterized protein YibQ